MNVDTEIASKAIAFRLKKVIPKLIQCDQTAYVNNRYIGETNHLISDMLEYTAENKTEAIFFSADFEKAFDSIKHTFIFATLHSFGFGPDIIQWVKTFLYKAESCVINNGSSTGYFYLERGTRQGDPIAAYLFILALEILFIQIRDNHHIKGIMIDGQEIKLSAYADDGNFLTTNVQSLNLIFNTCETFEQFSFLKLNLEKSEACWISSARGNADKPINCRWNDLNADKIRTLGVYSSYDTDLANKCNFFSIVDNIENCLNLWNSEDLTLAGRIQIFKTLAISKAVYISTIKNPPSLYLMKFNRDLFGIRKDQKSNTQLGSYEEGGYKDVDIATQFDALKIIWLRRLLDNNYHPLKFIPTKLFSPLGGVTFFTQT